MFVGCFTSNVATAPEMVFAPVYIWVISCFTWCWVSINFSHQFSPPFFTQKVVPGDVTDTVSVITPMTGMKCLVCIVPVQVMGSVRA